MSKSNQNIDSIVEMKSMQYSFMNPKRQPPNHPEAEGPMDYPILGPISKQQTLYGGTGTNMRNVQKNTIDARNTTNMNNSGIKNNLDFQG
jgi:hypothetical protein